MHKARSGSAALLLLVVSFLTLYGRVLARLVHDWATDDNYSHGFIILPVAAYFVFRRRHDLQRLPIKPAWTGLALVVSSVATLAVGLLGAELFLTRVSLVGVVAGTILFVLGWRQFSALLFPIAFLLLMIPIPAIIFNQIVFPLQLLASQVGAAVLTTFRIPVLREGNVIVLANATLEVAEACSGIRSLVSLLTLSIVYGYFLDRRTMVRALLAVLTVPVAILSNGLRVAGTGVAAHFYGAGAAEGFLHTFSGWLTFVLGFGLLCAGASALKLLLPDADEPVAQISPAV